MGDVLEIFKKDAAGNPEQLITIHSFDHGSHEFWICYLESLPEDVRFFWTKVTGLPDGNRIQEPMVFFEQESDAWIYGIENGLTKKEG